MPESVSSDHTKGLPGLTQAALFGLCPRCHERTLFDAPASVACRCSECGLEFAQLERGSRAATLVTFIVAAVLIGLALLVDEWLRPPLWAMAMVFVPLTITLVLGAIRLFKTLLLMARYERSQEQKEQSQ
ncbi:Cytochrome-c oxidase [Altererythrobacter insulae]|nr:Cytochrome-c oxidase [Altererythrobacter insulae]